MRERGPDFTGSRYQKASDGTRRPHPSIDGVEAPEDPEARDRIRAIEQELLPALFDRLGDRTALVFRGRLTTSADSCRAVKL